MVQWTETNKDVLHIVKISKEMPIAGIVELELVDGKHIEGVLRKVNIGNNAGRGGWKYYGELEIETKRKKICVIDYLNIKSAKNVWSNDKAKEYEELGLITIIEET